MEFWREREIERGWVWAWEFEEESWRGRVPRVRSAVVDEVVIPAKEAMAVLLLVLVEEEER